MCIQLDPTFKNDHWAYEREIPYGDAVVKDTFSY